VGTRGNNIEFHGVERTRRARARARCATVRGIAVEVGTDR